MRLRLTGLLVGMAFAGVMAAQESTSVVLKSGEQFNGQLVDLSAPGFTFEVNGEKRVVPKDDVVSINFEGSQSLPRPNQVNDLTPGQSALVLQNGEVVVGEFYDLGGTVPLRVTFRTATGQRDYSSNDVRAIWVAKPTAASAQSSSSAGGISGPTVTVQARTRWTPTNITVKRGQTVRFDANGTVSVNTRSKVMADPGGNTSLINRENPLPSAPTGALIGQIGIPGRGGTATPFLIGNQDSVTMPADGPLLLAVNDTELDDNSGTFQVTIAPEQ
jgi:hypothetical protein